MLITLILKSNTIEACLAVDALYFRPDFQITVDNCISETAFDEETKKYIQPNSFQYFSQNPSALETFLELNWEKIIKSAFVFQVQPYSINYKPFVIHIKLSPNGKSSEQIIKLLHQIREILQNRIIIIKSYAFDGDNAYKQLHAMYFESYIHGVIKKKYN